MSVFVVDASVIVKWFVPEIHSDAARRLLASPHEHVAPDLLFAEAANTIWKKVRRQELSAEQGQPLVTDIGRVAVETSRAAHWPRTHMRWRTRPGEQFTTPCTWPWPFDSIRG